MLTVNGGLRIVRYGPPVLKACDPNRNAAFAITPSGAAAGPG
jgi:hypothetical protein